MVEGRAENPLFAAQGSLQDRVTEINQFTNRLSGLLDLEASGQSKAGTILVAGNLQGVLRVEIDGSLVTRPNGGEIAQGLREAITQMNDQLGIGMRAGLREAFGIEVPEYSPGAAAATMGDAGPISGEIAEALAKLRREYPEQAVAVDSEIAVQHTHASSRVEVQSASGLVRATFDGLAQVHDIAFDTMQLREVDNLTLADEVLEVLQSAPRALTTGFGSSMAEAQREFDRGMAQAQASLDEAMRMLRSLS